MMSNLNVPNINTAGNERYAIIKKPAFAVIVGREFESTTDDPGLFLKVMGLWNDFWWSEDYFSLLEQNPEGTGPVTGAHSMSISFSDQVSKKLNYYIGVEKTSTKIPSGFKTITIPQATWAVFYSNGRPDYETMNYIFNEWFPTTGYKQADAPTLLTFLPIKPGMDYEVWIPIVDDMVQIPLVRKQEDWGRSMGFPSGSLAPFDKKLRVGDFSGGFERQVPDRVKIIKASGEVSPLKTNFRKDLTYEWGTGTRNVPDFLDNWPITGLIIARKGEVWAEEYRFDRKPDMRLTSWSMAKSITSLLLGICMDRGLIKSLDDTADMYVENLKGTLHGGISLRNLSNMSSGANILHQRDIPEIYSKGFVNPDSDLESVVRGWNKTQEPPGTRFNYNELCAFTVAMVIREVTGMGLAEFCQNDLWQPMGAESEAVWLTDSKGKEFNCVYFSARLRDWARLGRLVAQNGVMNGRQIVSKEWIDQCSSWSEKDQQVIYGKASPNMGYKTFFWHPREDGSWLMMMGAQMQILLTDRVTQTVLVQTAVDDQCMGIWTRELFELFSAATKLK